VSATLFELKRKLFGTVPLVESEFIQIGSVVVSTVTNGAGVTPGAVTATSTYPGVPEPLTYVRAPELGVVVTVKFDWATTCIVTAIVWSGAGAFTR
jgi:hypothetical protein